MGGAASARSASKAEQAFRNLDDRKASILCYIPWVGWIAAIVVLAADRFRENREVRFHAFQGLYLFVLWLFVDWVFSPMIDFGEGARIVGRILKVGVLAAWVFMIVKTSQGSLFRLPVLGELADRSVSEQK